MVSRWSAYLVIRILCTCMVLAHQGSRADVELYTHFCVRLIQYIRIHSNTGAHLGSADSSVSSRMFDIHSHIVRSTEGCYSVLSSGWKVIVNQQVRIRL